MSAVLLATEPDLPWAQIAGMRDRLAHRYFDTSHAIVHGTTDPDLPVLAARSTTGSPRLIDPRPCRVEGECGCPVLAIRDM